MSASEARLATDRAALQRDEDMFKRASTQATEELRNVGAALDKREDELSDGLETMAESVEQLELSGTLPESSAFLRKAEAAPPEHRPRVQTLVLRFTSVLKRAGTALAGGPEMRDERPENDGPWW